MTATVAQLGARALRKLGVAIVADGSRPGVGPTVTPDQVAALALRQHGRVVSDADRPALSVVVPQQEIAARALRAVGVNQVAGSVQLSGVVTFADVATRAIQMLGVNPAPSVLLPSGTVSVAEIAARAQRLVGVNPADIATGITAGPTFTKAEIGTKALLKLSIIDPSETPASTDQAIAEAKVAAVHDALVALDYVTWPVSVVPDRAAEFYVIMAAALLAPEFGKPASSEGYEFAKESLRVQALSGATSQARAEAKTMAVHNELVALGLADWPDTGIPASVSEAYADMVAWLIARVHGKAPDPREPDHYEAAKNRIRAVVLSGTRGQALAYAKVVAVHNELSALGLVDWTDQTVPVAVAESYAVMAAQQLSPVYGKGLLAEAYDGALSKVRRMALSGARGQQIALAKVAAVHDSLVNSGLASWAGDKIPQAYSEEYVALTGSLLAPVVGEKPDPEKRGEAEARIRRGLMETGAQDRAIAKVRAVHDQMNAMGLVSWDIAAIPSAMSDAYADLVATALNTDYGRDENPKAMGEAWSRVRQNAMGGPAGQRLAEQKVRAVHASLDARGRTRWTLYDLPLYAEEPYVMMAATLLAPEVDAKADPSWWPMAERDLMRSVAMPSSGGPVVASYF